MCSGSKREVYPSEMFMDDEVQKQDLVGANEASSLLLEFSAANDLNCFKHAVEQEGHDVDEAGLWYGRRIGSKKMGFEERTPLMIAAMFGSKDILNYVLQTGRVDVNRACGSDGATALHCAAAGGSLYSHEVIKLLVDSAADVDRVDANGNRPYDVIPCSSASKSKRKTLELMLKKGGKGEEACFASDHLDQMEGGQRHPEGASPKPLNDGNGSEKKEYPIDPSLPDIKNGIYGTDEFRMYTFKVKPCSRAYSHDWTECPFVHPGENARRRDPRKYHYSCVPCPEFRKGSCPKGDTCEYAHGIFECWLHPAQYRTRLCKDETNCSRRVCFFAHKLEELRPLYASTGSAVPSPRSYSSTANSFDMGAMSPLGLSSPSMMMPSTSTPPMTPTGASSPIGGGTAAWQNHLSVTPPTLQLPGSRLKAALNARDMDLKAEICRQQLLDELASLSVSSPSSRSPSWVGEVGRLGALKPTNLNGLYGTLDPAMLAQAQAQPQVQAQTQTQLQSPSGIQARHNMNQQLRSSYSSGLPSSPVRASSLGIDSCGSPVSNPRLAAFANRSQSFIDRSAPNWLHGGLSSPGSNAPPMMPPHLADWGSPDGKVDWGVQGDELKKLRKSASFGFRSNGSNMGANLDSVRTASNEPDVSWVQSLVKDRPTAKPTQLGSEEQMNQQYHLNSGGSERLPPWVEQLYMEQEQMVA